MATNSVLLERIKTQEAELLALRQKVREQAVEIHSLRARLEMMCRRMYGRSAEDVSKEQLEFAFRMLEREGLIDPVEEADSGEPVDEAPRKKRKKRRSRQDKASSSVPRREVVHEPEHTTCSCCGKDMARIGEERSEEIEIVPATVEVIVHVRPKYACSTCKEGVEIAPPPEKLFDRGRYGKGFVAQVLVSKFADHLPLYRQAQIYARQGIALDRSTLADWVGRAAFLLKPVHERLLDRLKASAKLFADETTAPVLDPGRGRTKTGQLFAYARDDRPWGGSDPPGVAYVYAADRKAERPIAHLNGFTGILQVDGYGGYKVLARRNDVQLAFCWSHVRRKFYELATPGPAPIAGEALTRIAELYRIEVEIRGRSAEQRRQVRQERSRPLVEALEPWLRDKLQLISQKTKLAEAIRYALSRWQGLCLFLDDGRVEIDNNVVERTIRPLALTRKNALFAGSDGGAEHWAVIASLVETCKLNGVEPFRYLADVIARIVEGHPQSRLDELLPWAYAAPQELKAVA